MASGFLIALAKKPPPERAGSASRGGDPDNMSGDDGSDGADRDELKDEPKDDYSKVVQSALDDLADILGVGDKDRDRFDSAMEDLAEAVAERCMNKES